jgi:non-ribosomal peptide synthetase component F
MSPLCLPTHVISVPPHCLQLLLSRFSAQEEIVVGLATACRDLPETQPLVGCFINTVPLLLRSAHSTLGEALRATEATVAAALDDSFVSLSEVMRALGPDAVAATPPGANPLFQVMFQHLGESEARLTLPGAVAEHLEVPGLGTAQLDLTLEVPACGCVPVCVCAGGRGVCVRVCGGRCTG